MNIRYALFYDLTYGNYGYKNGESLVSGFELNNYGGQFWEYDYGILVRFMVRKMGGDDFNKTDDDEDNSNYEIDINVIIEQSIKEHDKNIDQHKSINREWRDSFVEAIWRKIKNKVNNEITRIIKQEFHRRNYAHYNKNIERNVWIDLPTEVFFLILN